MGSLINQAFFSAAILDFLIFQKMLSFTSGSDLLNMLLASFLSHSSKNVMDATFSWVWIYI